MIAAPLPSQPVAVGAGAITDLSPIDRLRALRVLVQDLQTLLDRVRKGDAVLATYAPYVTDVAANIDDVVQKAMDDTVIRNHSKKLDHTVSGPEAPEYDEIQHLYNIWGQIRICPVIASPASDLSAQDQLQYLTLLDDQCREIVFRIGVVTIPPRLNQWLANATPGYYIPFHTIFEDELPSYDDRVRVLNYIAFSPKSLRGGIVDTANGLVYRYARSTVSQLVTLTVAAVTLALLSLAVAESPFVPLAGWPIGVANQGKVVLGWVALLAGIVVHLTVASSKRARAQPGLPPVLATGDLLPIVNAKIGLIGLKLFLALFGFFGFIFSSGIDNVTVFNAFLVGYSLDSFVELFSGTVEQRANAQVATLKQKLGPT